MEARIAALEEKAENSRRLMDGLDAKVNGISATTARIDNNTSEIIEVFKLGKDFITVLSWMSKIAKVVVFTATPFILAYGFTKGWFIDIAKHLHK